MPRHQGIGAPVSCSVSSDDKGASEIGRQARREAATVARATMRPSNKAWRPLSPGTIQRICGTGHQMRIADWPEDERPRERLLKHVAAALSEAELLAIFLRTGIAGKVAVHVARDVI